MVGSNGTSDAVILWEDVKEIFRKGATDGFAVRDQISNRNMGEGEGKGKGRWRWRRQMEGIYLEHPKACMHST